MNETVEIGKVLLPGGIRTGFSFRERVEHNPAGRVAVVQMKDLREGYSTIAKDDIAWVSGEGIAPTHHLDKGDVLFVAKGQNNHAVVFDLDLPLAVAASAFFVIRPDRSKVDPAYLAWWINQQPVQEYLHQNMAGTYIPNINRPTVEGITVPLPPIEHQRLIATVHGLAHTEQRIMRDLAAKRQQLIDHLLVSTIKEYPTNITTHARV